MNAEPTVRSAPMATHNAEKRKPTRRDPERRRRQNIEAQRRYRLKLKDRLDRLENIASTLSSSIQEASVPQLSDTNASDSSPHDSTQDTNDSPPDEQSLCQWTGLPDTADFDLGAMVDFDLSYCFNPILDVSQWDPATPINPGDLYKGKEFPTQVSKPIRYTFSISKPQPRAEYVDCGCPIPHIQMVSPLDIREVGSPEPEGALACRDANPNMLRLERICIVQAFMENAAQLGFTDDMMCGVDATSPFYQPRAMSSGAARDTVQKSYAHLKLDLRPLEEQFTVKHHPAIDVIPSPTFRRNLLRSSGFEEGELCYDLLNGLICWGGSRPDHTRPTCSTGSCTGSPWALSSWEARPWFLQKYWDLLGGAEGELVRQSEWWRSLRGDDSDIWGNP